MRIDVDPDRCEGQAVCVGLAPKVFELNDDDEVVRELERAGWRTRSLSGQSARYAVPGLVLSYSRLVARDADEFAARLRQVIDGR